MARLTSLLSAALAAGILLASPGAYAGDAEVSYLHSLAGDWTGGGKISGPDGGNVSCRIVMKPSGARLNFNGRCTAPGNAQAQSFSGSIRYSDQRRRFESSSNGITVVGSMSGSTLSFVTEQKTIQGQISSTMTVSPRSMQMKFHLVDPDGQTMQGTIPFRKS